jgi:transposase
VAVSVPTVDQENARDLVRAREDARGDLMRARHRLYKLLLRQGIVYSGGQAWTGAHDAWLRQIGRQLGRQCFDSTALRMTFESDYDAVLTVMARRDRLNEAIAAMAADSEFTPLVRRLGGLPGVSSLTAFALAVEIGDWHRFTGNTIAAFVGLVPSEYSSGAPGCRARGGRGGPRSKSQEGQGTHNKSEAGQRRRRRHVNGPANLAPRPRRR